MFSCSQETIKYTLTTSVNPADAGTVNPETRQYNEGDTANLIASPAAEYIFDKLNEFIFPETEGRVKVTKVKFMEHGKNAAYYSE